MTFPVVLAGNDTMFTLDYRDLAEQCRALNGEHVMYLSSENKERNKQTQKPPVNGLKN